MSDAPAPHSAFFYGTLMAPAVLSRVTGRPLGQINSSLGASATGSSPQAQPHLLVRPALLPQHRRHRVKHADYPAVVPSPATEPMRGAQDSAKAGVDAEVRGTYVEGLTDEEIWRLDLFEGDEYARRRVSVTLLPGEVDAATGVRTAHPGVGISAAAESGLESAAAERREAQTYIWIAGTHRLEEREWDFDEFVREKMWRWAAGMGEGIQNVDTAVTERNGLAGDSTGGRAIGGAFDAVTGKG